MRETATIPVCGEQALDRLPQPRVAKQLGHLRAAGALHGRLVGPHARYRCRPPLAEISPATVGSERLRRAAPSRHDRPACNPREISSRSASDRRSRDCWRLRGGSPPLAASRLCTDFVEHPTGAATASCRSPATIRRRTSRRLRWSGGHEPLVDAPLPPPPCSAPHGLLTADDDASIT